MPRLPRFFAPDTPLHVIQRGHNRQPIFGAGADLAFFKECLIHAAHANGVAIHAYALMTNHIHLLATPPLPVSLPRAMQAVGRVYVKYFNGLYDRTPCNPRKVGSDPTFCVPVGTRRPRRGSRGSPAAGESSSATRARFAAPGSVA